jgi:hypothetical protein
MVTIHLLKDPPPTPHRKRIHQRKAKRAATFQSFQRASDAP